MNRLAALADWLTSSRLLLAPAIARRRDVAILFCDVTCWVSWDLDGCEAAGLDAKPGGQGARYHSASGIRLGERSLARFQRGHAARVSRTCRASTHIEIGGLSEPSGAQRSDGKFLLQTDQLTVGGGSVVLQAPPPSRDPTSCGFPGAPARDGWPRTLRLGLGVCRGSKGNSARVRPCQFPYRTSARITGSSCLLSSDVPSKECVGTGAYQKIAHPSGPFGTELMEPIAA
jgi:hypothetical protein